MKYERMLKANSKLSSLTPSKDQQYDDSDKFEEFQKQI